MSNIDRPIVDVVRVDVRQERRDHRALGRPPPVLSVNAPSSMTPAFGNQPEHTAVADAVLQDRVTR
jgi:hypothetical protein